MKLGLVAFLLAAAAGCPAPVGSRAPVPSDSTAQCREYCQNIGLPLESLVIMASNVGCVCDARPPMAPMAPMPATSSTAASSTAGGMAAVMMEQEAEAQQNNQQTNNAAMMHH
jgi:hypothetical protein